MNLLYSRIVRLILLSLMLVLGTHLVLGADATADPAEVQSFFKGYEELAEKYPNAAKLLEIVDAKTRSQLPQCNAEQIRCCMKLDPPTHCTLWGCCPRIR